MTNKDRALYEGHKGRKNMNKDHIKEYFKTDASGGGQITQTPWIFKRLQLYVENSDWHNRETVYDHTNRVISQFESFYLNERSGAWKDTQAIRDSFAKLVHRAILWHDVGKISPQIVGDTIKYPGHELASAEIFYDVHGLGKEGIVYSGSSEREDKKRFFSPEDEFAYEFVKHHGNVHSLITAKNGFSELESLANSLPHVEKSCYIKERVYFDWRPCENPLNPKSFMKTFLYFGLAETMSSHLMNTRTTEYAQRLANYAKALDQMR